MELARFYALVVRRIMLPMTPAQTRANGLGNPSLPQLWLTAMLRMLVELVRNVVSTFQMRSFPLKRDWHTRDDEAPLPRMTSDTIKEHHAVPHDSPIALILSSAQSARPSKGSPLELVQWTNSSGERPERQRRAGVLTTVSHTHNGSVNLVHASPAKAGVQPSSDRSARSAPSPFAPSLAPGLRRRCVLREHAQHP